MRISKERVRDAGVDVITHMPTHHRELAQDETVGSPPFRFEPFQLAHMLDHRDLRALTTLGGIDGIIRGLGTHHAHGLTTEPSRKQGLPPDGSDNTPYTGTIDDRKRVYGENVLPARCSKTLLQLMADKVKDNILNILSTVAVASLALGLGQLRESDDPPVDWVEGVVIMVAITICVGVGSVNDWLRERQLMAPKERKEGLGARVVRVVRDDIERVVDIKEVVVGDIVLVEPGDIIPCDGIFISGHNVRCDDSGLTGESHAIKKVSYSELARSEYPGSLHKDCFMISGSKVLEGVGKYVVVTVGVKSFNGRRMMALRIENEKTPLHMKLNTLAESMSKVGSITGLVLFAALMVKLFVRLGADRSSWTPSAWGIELVNTLIISVTLVAIPEGILHAVTLALSIATNRMVNKNLHVRVRGSVETMANASVICTNKTGTLTQNSMTVVAGSVGIHAKFVQSLNENTLRTKAEETDMSALEAEVKHMYPLDFSIDQANLNRVLSNELMELFNEAIAINTKAFEDDHPITGKKIFVGSKTDTALLQFAKDLNWRNARETRDAADVVQTIPFSSDRKAMGVVIKKPHGGYRAYFKGASEILVEKSTKHIVVSEDGTFSRGVETKEIDELSRQNSHEVISFYANQMLRTIALCYRDFDSWPPVGTTLGESNEVPFDDLAKDLTLVAIVAIKDPLREGVRDAVVTGHGTNGGPALRTAVVGFSMGIAGTEVAKEASDIILMDDSFASIVKAIMWGRCMNDSVRKVLQFQVSTNITAIVTTLISSLVDFPVLSVVQLFWVNIIIDTLAAVALVTDPASEKLLNRKPDKKTAPLFTVQMCKLILLQSVYQIAVILFFHFFGLKILELEDTAENRNIVKTLVFNVFAFAQIFNSVNCRRLDSRLDIFEGILKNRYFIPITLIEIVVQIVINFVGGAALKVTRIGPCEWGLCIALGFVSIPWGFIIHLLPTKPFEWLFRAFCPVREENGLPVVKPDQDGWNTAISRVRDNLSSFSKIRRHRLRSSSFLKTRRSQLPNHDQTNLSSILTMVPTLVSQPVVDHVSGVLDKIRADTLYIVGWEDPKSPAPNIGRRQDYSEILEIWKEIELRAQRPAEFLSVWGLVEDYEKFIHELQLSISGAHTMTEDVVNDFRRRLNDFVRDFKANANASNDAAPHLSQVPSNDYGPAFFKGIGKIRISGGHFVMNVTQPIVPKFEPPSSSQSETYLKEIRNFTYFRTFIELAILF